MMGREGVVWWGWRERVVVTKSGSGGVACLVEGVKEGGREGGRERGRDEGNRNES